MTDREIAETGNSREWNFMILNCKEINKLKKIVLTITSIFMIIIIGIIIVNDIGYTAITNDIWNSKGEIFQEVKSNNFDIMSIVKVYKSADGGVMPL